MLVTLQRKIFVDAWFGSKYGSDQKKFPVFYSTGLDIIFAQYLRNIIIQ